MHAVTRRRALIASAAGAAVVLAVVLIVVLHGGGNDALTMREVDVAHEQIPVPAAWTTQQAAGSDVLLAAVSPDGQSEETVRRGRNALSAAQTVPSLRAVLKTAYPDLHVGDDRAVTVAGASSAWVLVTTYTETDRNGHRVPVHEADVIAHASGGDDVHIIVVTLSGFDMSAVASELVRALRLAPQASAPASFPASAQP